MLLKAINEKIPTHAVIFDVSTDRGIRSGNQTLTEIMYGLFLQSLGYAKDLDLSELEIALEEKGQLEAIRGGVPAPLQQGLVTPRRARSPSRSARRAVFCIASIRQTYPMADSWVKAVKNKADISPGQARGACQ